jgi:hypothetical protein
MSTPSQDTPTNALGLVPTGPERAAAIMALSAALAQLGDDASHAALNARDVRLHVVACQAHHLAGDVWDLLTVDADPEESLPPAAGFASSVTAVRRALEAPVAQPLPAALAASLGWLLQLADAVSS